MKKFNNEIPQLNIMNVLEELLLYSKGINIAHASNAHIFAQ